MVAPSFSNTPEAPRRMERSQSMYSNLSKSLACKTTTIFSAVFFVIGFTLSQHTAKYWKNTFSSDGGTESIQKTVSLTSGSEYTYVRETVGNQLGKCKKDMNPHRWSKIDFPKSDAPSLFNCDLPDSLCTYYFPADFFDVHCGIGKKFVHFIEDAKAMKQNNTLWNFMPSVGFPTLTLKNSCLKTKTRKSKRKAQTVEKAITTTKFRSQTEDMDTLSNIGEHKKTGALGGDFRCLTERLSFIHVHKAGGSSLHNAFNEASKSANATITRHKFWQPPTGPGSRARPRPVGETTEQFTLDSLSRATKYPAKEFEPAQHVIFAVVRDPTERFISSIGQATGAIGSAGNKIGPVLKEACLKNTSTETLKCMAKYVRDHGFWIELHFTPQVIDISFTTMWQDVPLSVFSFKHLKTVLGYFENQSQMRNGAAEKYRSSDVLKNMTVADYDDETLRIVCEIYEMDVLMQRSLGLEVPRCDPYIPQS